MWTEAGECRPESLHLQDQDPGLDFLADHHHQILTNSQKLTHAKRV